ncbi:MAG: 2TM domain-containing protein [Flavobacteriaceae bacterium]|nr:2TM domain-containing protein [Flavobacteriaceae bacterium]
MKNHNQDDAYSRARYKVEKIKRFYKHLAAYIIVNSLIFGIKIIRNLTHGETFSEAFFDINFYGIWLFWGIGLVFHAFAVFGTDYFFGKNWEENKIKQFMEEDGHSFKSNNK